jgi:hypothetical protein
MRPMNSYISQQKKLLYDTRQTSTTSQTIPPCPSSHIQMNSRERLTATCTGHVSGSSSLIDLSDFSPKNQKLFFKFKSRMWVPLVVSYENFLFLVLVYDHFFPWRSILLIVFCFSLILTFSLPYFKWTTKAPVSDPSIYFRNSIKKIESKLASVRVQFQSQTEITVHL